MGKLDVRIRHGGGGPDPVAMIVVGGVVVIGALIYEALKAFARMLGDIAAVAVVATVSAATAVGLTLLIVRLRQGAVRRETVHAEAITAAFAREHQARAAISAPSPLALPAPVININLGDDLARLLARQPAPVVVVPPAGEEDRHA